MDERCGPGPAPGPPEFIWQDEGARAALIAKGGMKECILLT